MANMNDILNATLKDDMDAVDIVEDVDVVDDIDDLLESAITAPMYLSDVLVPSGQVVTDTIADRIKSGVLFDMDVTMFLDRNERQNVVSRALTELEKERAIKISEYKAELRKVMEKQALDIDPDFEYPTNPKEEGYLDEDVKPIWFEYKKKRDDAEKTIEHFKELPYTVCAAILIASGAVQGITYVHGDDSNADMLLVYRQFRGKTPTLWAEINPDNKKPLAEIAHYTSVLNAKLTKGDREQLITILKKDAPKTFVPTHDANIMFVGNGVIDATGIKYNPQLDMNVDENGEIAKFYPYGTEEAERIIFKEFPMRYTCPKNFHPEKTMVLPVFHNADGTDWNIIDSIKELYDEPYKVQYAFENLQGTVRGSNYGRATIHANKDGGAGGGNGKSTFIAIKTELIGQQYVLSVSISTLGKDQFATEELPKYSAVMCGENGGSEDDKYDVTKFKWFGRQDEPLFINRKHTNGLTIRWSGPADWAMNEGKINPTDPSDSVYACVEILVYSKNFRGAKEREYIKKDYVKRDEALEYLLWYLIVKFPWREDCRYSPEVLKKMEPAKAAFRAESRPAMTFLSEVLLPSVDEDGNTVPAGVNVKRLPVEVLYEMFCGWALSRGRKSLMNLDRFKMDVASWCNDHYDDYYYVPDQFRMVAEDVHGEHDDQAIIEHSGRLGNYLDSNTYTSLKGSYKWAASMEKKRFRGGVYKR